MNKFLLLILIPFRSFSAEMTYSDYFKDFSKGFSLPEISAETYSRLSSYKLDPKSFIDFGKNPPDSYNSSDILNSDVIFNGERSKKYFIKFINSAIINQDISDLKLKENYKGSSGNYSFEVKSKENKLIILENMLISAPEDMNAEISCSYIFNSDYKGKIKLSNVFCAG